MATKSYAPTARSPSTSSGIRFVALRALIFFLIFRLGGIWGPAPHPQVGWSRYVSQLAHSPRLCPRDRQSRSSGLRRIRSAPPRRRALFEPVLGPYCPGETLSPVFSIGAGLPSSAKGGLGTVAQPLGLH